MQKDTLLNDDFSSMVSMPNHTGLIYLIHNNSFLIKIPKFGTLNMFFII